MSDLTTKHNITLLSIHLREAAEYARRAGLLERCEWLLAVAASIETKYPEFFVK